MAARGWVNRIERLTVTRLPASWQARLRSAHPGHKATLRGMVWLATFVLAAKAIAAIKEVAVAYHFGTSEVLEGYLLVFNLAAWPISLLYGVMSFVLVPELVRRQQSPDGGRRWQREVTTWVWGLALIAGVGVAMVLPPLIRSGWLGLGPAGREAALATPPTMGAVVTLGIVGAWHACQLMSRQRHANTFLEAMPALGILGMVLLVPSPVVGSLLWGTVLGFAVQAVLLVVAVRAIGLPVVPAASGAPPLNTAMLRRLNVLLAAQVLLGLGGIVDQIILAHLPPGELAAFGYANRVMALVLTLSSTVTGRALLPVLSGLTAQEGYAIARRWAWLLFWLGGVVAVLVMVGAAPVIALLFERGAFTAAHSEQTASILKWMAPQLPLYLVGTVWVQWLLSQPGRIRALWWAAVWSVSAKLAVSLALIHTFDWRAEAVAAGLVVAYAVYLIPLRLAIVAWVRAFSVQKMGA